MNVGLGNFEYLATGVNLSNQTNVVANSCSVVQGNKITNILDLLPGGSQAAPTIDAYTKLQTDTILINKAEKNNTYTELELDAMLLATKGLIDSKEPAVTTNKP